MRILVTGASGFIRKAFAKALIAEKLCLDVFCTIRKTSQKEDLEKLDVTLVDFDLTDHSTFASAVRGMDIVVHFAAHYNFNAPKEILFSHNVEASQKLAEACLEAKVKHFVYCSSAEALDLIVDGTEESNYNPDEIYGGSKMETEKILLTMQEEKGLPLTIARPTGVIGPGECYPFNDIIFAVDKGIIFLPKFLPGSGKGTIHWTDIDDIVQGFIKIIQMPEKSIGKFFNLASDHSQTWNEVVEVICHNLGIKSSTVHIPAFLARIGLPLFILYYKLRGVKNFVLYPNAVKKLQTSRSYSNLKAKTELGFDPVVTFDTSVKKAVVWLRGQGKLKGKS